MDVSWWHGKADGGGGKCRWGVVVFVSVAFDHARDSADEEHCGG